jgi:DNA polymerase
VAKPSSEQADDVTDVTDATGHTPARVPARPSLRNLREGVNTCRACDLYQDATQGVMGDGPLGARLMLIGEQPGDVEDRTGRPFVGPAGRLLDRALEEAGLQPGDGFRTNVVKHFRHVVRGGKRIHQTPVRWQIAACEPWVLAELGLVRPQIVVILGATAGKSIFGPGFRVGRDRGRELAWPGPGTSWGSALVPAPVAVATAHPSAVLRSRNRTADFAALVRDLVVARDLLDRS